MTDRKKVAVIGRGTAGAVSIISMLKQKHYIHKTYLPHEFPTTWNGIMTLVLILNLWEKDQH